MAGRLTVAWAFLAVCCWAGTVSAQVGSGARTGVAGTGTSNNPAARTQGFQQTGQLSSAAAIQRNSAEFVGASQGNFLSPTGGQGGTANLSGLSGLSRFGTTGLGRGGTFGGNTRNRGLLNQNTQMGRGGVQMRAIVRLGFSVPRPSSNVVSAQFQSRLARLPALKSAKQVTVKMAGETAVLEGVVATAQQRDLIERLALLEPGIASVQNDLKIQGEASPNESSGEPVPPRELSLESPAPAER